MEMYSFRIRCNVPNRSGITWDEPSLRISPEGVFPEVRLASDDKEAPLSMANRFIVSSDGYKTEEDAWAAAQKYRDVLIRAFSRLRIAADFGDRAPKGGMNEAYLRLREERSGHRALKDVHGMMVFTTEPRPEVFVSAEGSGFPPPPSGDRLAQAINDSLEVYCELSDRERLAFDLFGSSFSASSTDAIFLELMMAVETLFDPKLRSQTVLRHVESLITATREAVHLPESERKSICSALARLNPDPAWAR